MANKHYWKKNEILYLLELENKFKHDFFKFKKITREWNQKYSYDLTEDEIKKEFEYVSRRK